MTTPATWLALVDAVKAILPEASIEEDNLGQVVIYTNLMVDLESDDAALVELED